MAQCPICWESPCPSNPTPMYQGKDYDCPRCGKFVLCGPLSDGVSESYFTPYRRAVMSHRLRCMQPTDGRFLLVFEKELASFRLDDPLPSPAEQADRLILWIGVNQRSPAENAQISASTISAIVGIAITPSAPNSGLDWLLLQSELKPFIDVERTETSDLGLSLTMAG